MSRPSEEKTVYFVRHGQSEDNRVPVFQSLESPLSADGKEQARRIAERVAKLSFEALVASPLPRTRDTAEAIAAVTGKEPEYSDLFVERKKPKSLYGRLHADPEALALWKTWNDSIYASGVRVEDGENFDDIRERADQALAFLLERPEKDLVVVTHSFFLKTLVARVLLGDSFTGETFREVKKGLEMENSGLTVLKRKDRVFEGTGWYLWTFNDHAHLG